MSALSFFQPAYLWALGFLTAILFLHLFRRKSVRRMDISTLRFFPARAVSRSRARKLIDALLLVARLIIAAALALAFAGPHDARDPLVALGDPRGAVYVWIDPTVSMEFAEGGASSGQRAAALFDTLAGVLPASVERYLFDHESGRFLPAAERTDDGGRGFAGRFGPADVEEAVDAFIASAPSARPAAFVAVSDFQIGTVSLVDSLLPRLAGNGGKTILVSVAPSKPYNYSIRISGNSSMKGGIAATVSARGAPLDAAFAELTVGGLRVGQRSVSCPKDDSVTVAFDMPQALDGSWGRVELRAADPLPFDNRDWFTVSADRGRSALIVGGAERNRVVGAALRAAGPSFWNPVAVKEGGDVSYEDLNSADLVIVSGFGGRSRILESFISGAGSDKGIILALDPDREDDFGRTYARGGLSKSALAAAAAEGGAHPVLADTNSALWRGFPAALSRNSRVYRYVAAIPGDALVRLGNSRPLASFVRNAGSGADVMLVATPIGVSPANNLCETGFYVPFVDRLGRYALSGRGRDGEAWYAGYPARNPFFGAGRAGALYDQDGKLAASWSSQPFVRIDRPGVYSTVSSTGESAPLAVSAHPRESEMLFSKPDLQGAGGAGGVYYYEYGRFMERIGNLGNNAWSYRLWLILGAMLCVEAFLWKRGGNRGNMGNI